jgi:hypothetical protein
VNCFVVASGDSDFSPLVSKLKENNKYVIGLGVKNSTSDLLIENCDEFIFYEDLVRGQQRQLPQMEHLPDKQREAFALLVDSVLALQRENKEVLWGSMVKETMKRKRPSFNETYFGFRTFSHLLEEAQRKGIVSLRRDQKSGSYIIEDLGSAAFVSGAAPAPRPEPVSAPAINAPPAAVPAPAAAAEEANGSRSRRRRGRGRRGGRGVPAAPGAGAPEAAVDEGPELDEADEELAGEEAQEEPPAAPPAQEPAAAAPAAPTRESDAGAPPAPEPAPDRAAEPAQSGERPFSLFSWMRRSDE